MAEIAVLGRRGILTLRGNVECFSERRAEHKARGAEGVLEVINHLTVDLLDVARLAFHHVALCGNGSRVFSPTPKGHLAGQVIQSIVAAKPA